MPRAGLMRWGSAQQFHIAPHVFVCLTGDGSVLLDLKRDQYLGLGMMETLWVASAVNAWPKPIWDGLENSPPPDEGAVQQLLASLADAGILTRNAEDSVLVGRRAVIDMKTEWISIGDELEVESRITAAHVVNFAMAFAEARLSLALRPFEATVERVRLRKATRGRETEVCHALQVAAMVDVFRRLRPFIFAAEGRCLLHALTLVNFLARCDFYPEWVIGVSTQPWGAHSWVQWGDLLLDTNPEKVCQFAPILVV
jgi:Transglutaminase-like superfamily